MEHLEHSNPQPLLTRYQFNNKVYKTELGLSKAILSFAKKKRLGVLVHCDLEEDTAFNDNFDLWCHIHKLEFKKGKKITILPVFEIVVYPSCNLYKWGF